jgi:hypothetical protein
MNALPTSRLKQMSLLSIQAPELSNNGSLEALQPSPIASLESIRAAGTIASHSNEILGQDESQV